MTFLKEKEIIGLLKTMSPQEIRSTKDSQLDEDGYAFLAELEADIREGHALFADYGHEYQALDKEDSEKDDPFFVVDKKDASAKNTIQKIIKPVFISLSIAAALMLVFFLPRWIDSWNIGQVRGRSVDIDQIEPINMDLVEVLVRRGSFLLEAGNKTEKTEYYQEALQDLNQAYDLAPKREDLLRMLAIVYEKLGHEKEAKTFYEKWRMAKGATE